MALALQITSGTRAGQREEFSRSVVVAGRHPQSDLRFDATGDLDVSTRHAEFRGSPQGWTVRDLGSTNGTFVNGERIAEPRAIRAGDVVTFGANGPRVSVVSTGAVNEAAAAPRTNLHPSPPSVPKQKTDERIAIAVAAHTSSLKRFVVGLGVVVVVGVGALVWLNQRSSAQSNERIAVILARNDSLTNALQTALAQGSGREAGLDSVVRNLERERGELARQLASASGADIEQLSNRMDALNRRTVGVASAATMDFAQISEANARAIVFVAIQEPSGKRFSGTGFTITPDGLIVTNRHVALDDEDRPPIAAQACFNDSEVCLPAKYVSSDRVHDIAFLQIDAPGVNRLPTVRGISSSASLRMGNAIAVIGFPLGTKLPQDGETLRATLSTGIVSKSSAQCEGVPCIQIDAYAAEGASGSPVFDNTGNVIGVLFGGASGTDGRVVYIVPGVHLIEALPSKARSIVR